MENLCFILNEFLFKLKEGIIYYELGQHKDDEYVLMCLTTIVRPFNTQHFFKDSTLFLKIYLKSRYFRGFALFLKKHFFLILTIID
jgi:hypothetical protein